MKTDERERGYGAKIERGEVAVMTGEGAVVRSFCRDGIITPPLPHIGTGDALRTGDKVWFFLFPDGTGAVIARMPER